MFFKLSSLLLLVVILSSATFPQEEATRILYLMHRQKCKEALLHYLSITETTQEHDFSLLQEAALAMLREGAKQEDAQVQLMCLLASSICRDPTLLFIHKQALNSNDLQLQLASISVLGQMVDEAADELLFSALSSPFLITRLEALFHLARRGHIDIFEKMQSLFAKCPPLARPLFAQIVTLIDTQQGDRFIKQLLLDADIEVRIEALRQVSEKKLDQFLPQVQRLAKQNHISQQEAALIALSSLSDSEAVHIFETAQTSIHKEVSLAALVGLHRLGHKEALLALKERARKEDLFAIWSLANSHDQGTRELLYTLATQSTSMDVRLNALLVLVQLKDASVFPLIDVFLFRTASDLGFHTLLSPGRCFKAYQIIPSATQNEKYYPTLSQTGSALKQALLVHLLEIDEAEFIKLAKRIIIEQQKELIPLTVQLLENIHNEDVITFLEKYSLCSSSPLVRGFCALALYRLDPTGKNSNTLLDWIKNQTAFTMIQVKKKELKPLSSYTLTYEETSQLFLEALEAISMQKSFTSIDTLLHLIAHGNEKNRYALAGLLIKTAE
jgi:HEAT repeat protein